MKSLSQLNTHSNKFCGENHLQNGGILYSTRATHALHANSAEQLLHGVPAYTLHTPRRLNVVQAHTTQIRDTSRHGRKGHTTFLTPLDGRHGIQGACPQERPQTHRSVGTDAHCRRLLTATPKSLHPDLGEVVHRLPQLQTMTQHKMLPAHPSTADTSNLPNPLKSPPTHGGHGYPHATGLHAARSLR